MKKEAVPQVTIASADEPELRGTPPPRAARGSHPSGTLVAKSKSDQRAIHLLSQTRAREGTDWKASATLLFCGFRRRSYSTHRRNARGHHHSKSAGLSSLGTPDTECARSRRSAGPHAGCHRVRRSASDSRSRSPRCSDRSQPGGESGCLRGDELGARSRGVFPHQSSRVARTGHRSSKRGVATAREFIVTVGVHEVAGCRKECVALHHRAQRAVLTRLAPLSPIRGATTAPSTLSQRERGRIRSGPVSSVSFPGLPSIAMAN